MAEANQEHYKNQQESQQKELNSRRYKATNFPKTIRSQGLSENSCTWVSVSVLKLFDSNQNTTYWDPNDLKFARELHKHTVFKIQALN